MSFAALLLFAAGADPAKPTAREALQPLAGLVGSWKGTGSSDAAPWRETTTWGWKFKGTDAWLTVAFADGKHFTAGELRYSAEKSAYTLAVTAADKSTQNFTGTLAGKVLTLDRTDAPKGEDQRLVFTLLHANRHLYRLDARPAGSTGEYVKRFQVGATKEGEAFAGGDTKPVCVVTGGVGTIKVSFGGKDYYVCCTGCKDEFNDDPQRYVTAVEAKEKK